MSVASINGGNKERSIISEDPGNETTSGRKKAKFKIPEYLLAMNEAEKELNHKIIRNMNKRINYTRNPRYKVDRAPLLYEVVRNFTRKLFLIFDPISCLES